MAKFGDVHPPVMEKVNFAEKLGLFDDRWAPKIVAQMNDVHFKLAKVEGSFVWHEHGDTDEVFIVVDGTLCIEFEDQTVTLETGEMLVVPKGTRHRPYAEATCSILLVEPTGVVNTGDGGHDEVEVVEGQREARTAANDVWV
jgi:mannose-6-phosphate isomerase-like protein (cupin superfamily)